VLQTESVLPGVSVVMPTFNRRVYLDRAIDSVLAQTHDKFELVIVNDGSGDGTSEILERRAAGDSRIVVHSRRNHGVAASRNYGIEAAQFELIAVMDDDDLMLPNRLREQAAFLASHPDVSATTSYAHLIDENDRIIGKSCPRIDIEGGKATRRPSSFLDIIHGTAMFRRSDFLRVGGYRAIALEDRDLWGRFVTSGYKIVVQPKYFYHVRRHSTNISRSSGVGTLTYGDYIDFNVTRRLDGLEDITFEEYLHLVRTAPLPAKLMRFLTHRSRCAYDKATLQYSKREWARFAGNLALALILQPLPVAKRLRSKLVWRGRDPGGEIA
jgi:alpha-1,3-rhamnosyltransferase